MTRKVVLFALVATTLAFAPRAIAASPTVRLDRTSVAIGERVMVILEGWPVQRSVTITVCGNAARRGSVDCAVTRSQGYGISGFDKVNATSYEIGAPPVPCPCVVQVANATFSEIAFAPIEIVDHAIGPVVAGAVDAPLSVDLEVTRRNSFLGGLRSALGGPTTYAVTVVVRNRVGEALNDVKLSARASRLGNEQAQLVRFAVPKSLPANAMWTDTKTVTVPAPSLGGVDWTLTASGAGPTTIERATTSHRPLLFYVFAAVLLADIGWYGKRRLTARRRSQGDA